MVESNSGDVGPVTDRAPMPAEIAKAIVAVMMAVPKLAKGETNTHGKYNFASIDDFLEAIRPLCSQAGLLILQDEEAFEARDQWLEMRFSFTLIHESGQTWAHRPQRSILVSSKMGAQAFGAAQSYALKQFMRSLFQIATGEKGQDADEHPQEALPEKRSAVSLEVEQWAHKYKEAIESAVTVEEIDTIVEDNAEDFQKAPQATRDYFDGLTNNARAHIRQYSPETVK